MAFNENLAGRIRSALGDQAGLTEKKMFGGIAFMLHGNMVCGVTRDDLMVRVGPQRHDEALARPHARPMDFTGRAMKGMVFVGRDGYAADGDLRSWIDLALSHAGSLPAKR
jgi:hypothetical protein